jgi:hypothetical protein
MSSILMDAPTVQINASGLQHLIKVIFLHEPSLKEFGAIKIQLSSDCILALKKRKIWPPCTSAQVVTKVGKNELIYYVHTGKDGNKCTQSRRSIPSEATFWSYLAHSNKKFKPSNVSILPDKSLFSDRYHRKFFDIHCFPRQSLLRLAGREVIDQFVPCLTRAHGPGAIFPLACARQRLNLLDYHHDGGARHWYVIPTREREILQELVQRETSSICFEHQELFIDPSVLDKHHIRYHRIVQYPNEIVVLAAGALAQSFMDDAGWNESIEFALPSWIEEGHATACESLCQCNVNLCSLPKAIDVSSFTRQHILKYTATCLNSKIDDDKKPVDKG